MTTGYEFGEGYKSYCSHDDYILPVRTDSMIPNNFRRLKSAFIRKEFHLIGTSFHMV